MPENPSTTAGEKEKYATYYHDGRTDLAYADQRYYATGAGRFMTADPAGSGLNWYAYTSGDPVNRLDVAGLEDYWTDDFDPADPLNINSQPMTVTPDDDDAYYNRWVLPLVFGQMQSPVVYNAIATGGTGTPIGDGMCADPVGVPYLCSDADNYNIASQNTVNATSSGLTASTGSPSQQTEASSSSLGNLLSVATALPEMFWKGWAAMLLNNDPKGALQVVGSLAPVVVPGAISTALAPSTMNHFTTAAGYAGITASGQVLPGWAISGWGVYGTTGTAASVSWPQVSTEAVVVVDTSFSTISMGIYPGWWRAVPNFVTLNSYGLPIVP